MSQITDQPLISRETPLDRLPEFLTVEETARFLDTSKGCVYEAIKAGQLKALKVGRLLRVYRTSLRGDRQ